MKKRSKAKRGPAGGRRAPRIDRNDTSLQPRFEVFAVRAANVQAARGAAAKLGGDWQVRELSEGRYRLHLRVKPRRQRMATSVRELSRKVANG